MRSNDTMLKLRRFEVNEKQQKVNEIESMMADFQRVIDDLSHQIEVEEETSRIRDVNHFSYPPYAKAARKRRDNLRSSIESLEAKAADARAELNEALEELRKGEMLDERSTIEHDRSAHKPHGRDTLAVSASHLFNSRA
jgi:flagellar FliJ protein